MYETHLDSAMPVCLLVLAAVPAPAADGTADPRIQSPYMFSGWKKLMLAADGPCLPRLGGIRERERLTRLAAAEQSLAVLPGGRFATLSIAGGRAAVRKDILESLGIYFAGGESDSARRMDFMQGVAAEWMSHRLGTGAMHLLSYAHACLERNLHPGLERSLRPGCRDRPLHPRLREAAGVMVRVSGELAERSVIDRPEAAAVAGARQVFAEQLAVLRDVAARAEQRVPASAADEDDVSTVAGMLVELAISLPHTWRRYSPDWDGWSRVRVKNGELTAPRPRSGRSAGIDP